MKAFAQWWKDVHTELSYRMPNHVYRRILQAKDIADYLLLAVALCALFVLLFCVGGCHTYTVVSADRRLVPVRHAPEVSADVYYRTEGKDATGWYVPDAVMLELMDAE